MHKLLAKLSEDMPQEPACNQINRPDDPTSNDFNSLKVHRGSTPTPSELDEDFQVVRVLRKTKINAQGTSHSLPDPENDEFLPTCDPFLQCDSNVITPTQSTVSEFSTCAHQYPFECLQPDDSSEFGHDEENCPNYEIHESQPIDSVFFLDHRMPEAKIQNLMPRAPKSWRTESNLPESWLPVNFKLIL